MRILTDKKIEGILKCPVCQAKMTAISDRGSLVCEGQRRHCYDFASSGYVNLCSPTQSGGGDSKQAVRARSSFLNNDYYEPVAKALAKMCEKHGKPDGVLLDAGCGEGYYSAFLSDEGFSVIGVDLSKFAVDAASKRLSKKGADKFLFATASVFDLPVADRSIDVLTNVFAPCAEEEYKRVLTDNGVLIVAWAGENHLLGLKQAIYDEARKNDGRADMPVGMDRIDEICVSYKICLKSEEEIKNLFAMTPYYWRTSAADVEKLNGLCELCTDVDIVISVFRKRP